MSIINQLVPEGPPIYYTVEFKRVLEDHLDFIKQHSTTTSIAVNPALAFKHEYNLSGYLLAIDIPLKLHWLVMRLNGFFSDTDFINVAVLHIPSDRTVQQIKQLYESSHSD